MANKRHIEKFNSSMLKEVSCVIKTILRNKKIMDTCFILTRVETTKDLSFSFIYFKPMFQKDEVSLLKHLNHASSKIGFILAPKFKSRRFPRIHFKIEKEGLFYNEHGSLDIEGM